MVCLMEGQYAIKGWTGDLGMLKKAFLDRLFPKEKWESKVVEFINVRQGGISVFE